MLNEHQASAIQQSQWKPPPKHSFLDVDHVKVVHFDILNPVWDFKSEKSEAGFIQMLVIRLQSMSTRLNIVA